MVLGITVFIFLMYYCSSKFILPHRHLKVVHGGHSKIFLSFNIFDV